MAYRVKTAHPRALDAWRVVQPTRYRIVVKGRLSESFVSVFEGCTLEPLPGETALEGDFVDQSQLHGLLDRLRNLGVELVSINAV
jgi:hypothetical protein